MSYQLGIDLGTTYTAAAVCRSTDRGWVEPEVVTLGTRTATVPSVLFIAPDGSVLVGEVAERRAVTDPDRVVREFKRRIGDPTPVMVAGTARAPEELSAQIVRWVVDQVAQREGGAAAGIAVTHPASWGQHKKELLAAALAGQGLTVTFLAEPQAAALHYSANERVPAGSTIAIYDLGGGTFDAAVVRKADQEGPAGFGLLGRPEGLERLGGVDFDEVVFEHVREGMPAAFTDLDDTDPAVLSAVARLRRDCTEAKEALSSDTEVSIPVLMPAARGSVRLHRSEFESMIRPQVAETVTALRTAVRSAGCEPQKLTAVLLVGGSSRIPLVAQLVSEQLGRPVAVDADPKNAIAKGAALAISPKPTASWPGVAIGPAAAAAARAGIAAPADAGIAAAAPPRPPMPGAAAQARSANPPPTPARPRSTRSSRGPVGPVHESANALFSGGGQSPAPSGYRPRVTPEPVAGWDHQPARRRRPNVGLLVGIGGLLAVLAVVIVVVVLSSSASPLGTSLVGPAGDGSTTKPTATTAPPVANNDSGGGSAPSTANQPGNNSGNSTKTTPQPDTGTGGTSSTPTQPGTGSTSSAPTQPGTGSTSSTPAIPSSSAGSGGTVGTPAGASQGGAKSRGSSTSGVTIPAVANPSAEPAAGGHPDAATSPAPTPTSSSPTGPP